MPHLSIVLALLLCAFSAQAQVVSLTNYINTQLPDNTSRSITAANVRNANLAIVNNFSSIPYAGQVSTAFPVTASTYFGDGSHLTGIAAGTSPSWYAIQNIPTVIQGISNSTGSVTVTSINAAAATLTNITAGALTASGVVSANTLDSFFISGTSIWGAAGTFPGGVTIGNGTSNVTIAGGTLTATGIVSAPTVTATNVYASNVSTSTATVSTLTVTGSCSGCSGAASAGGPNSSIQYNSGTALAGSSAFTLTSGTSTVAVSVSGTISATQALNTVAVSAVTVAGTLQTAAQPNITSLGTLTSISDSGVLNVGGAVSMSSLVFSGGLLTANAGVNVTGAVTATTTLSAPIVSATGAGLYTTAISASSLAQLTTVSTTGFVSNSATYSNYMREGVLTANATTATTALNLGLATLISTSISSVTTVTTTNVNYTQGNITIWKVCQDGTGGRTITWPANARFSGSISPSITTTASTCSVFTLTPLPGTNSGNILVTMPATGVSN